MSFSLAESNAPAVQQSLPLCWYEQFRIGVSLKRVQAFTTAYFIRSLRNFFILHLVARDELIEQLSEGNFNTRFHFLKEKPWKPAE